MPINAVLMASSIDDSIGETIKWTKFNAPKETLKLECPKTRMREEINNPIGEHNQESRRGEW